MPEIDQTKIDHLKNFLSNGQISSEKEVLETYGSDWLKLYSSDPSLVLFPESHQNVEDIVKWAHRFHCPLVASGGRTGLSGAAVAKDKEVIVSFERMNRVLEFNEVEQSLTLESGVITKRVQEEAQKRGLFFPLSFASEGSSQIGGNVATNAGGVHVIRYGPLRKWISNVKVVTGRGQTLQLGRNLIKNVAGYDLMNLFIGSEGTLGLITEVSVRLTKAPKSPSVFLLAIPNLSALLKVYTLFKSKLCLNAFEMFTQLALEYVEKIARKKVPLQTKSPYYVLLECEENSQEESLKLFESSLENGDILDGVMSENSQQASELWSIRENISESLSPFTPYKNDVSVRISDLSSFLAEMNQILEKEYPDFSVVWFGHVGDGNLHINVLKPEPLSKESFLEKCTHVNEVLFSVIKKYKGSISAEHGVGLLKKPYLHYSCSESEIHYMKAIKKIFDPNNILNIGKIFD